MPLPRKIPLIQLPTPLHRLNRLSDLLGIDLWIKRDDLTGLVLGGNKGRKLEYLMASALDQRADVVVTCGAMQSNFVRQLGAACAMTGMRCAAAVMRTPFDKAAGKPIVVGLDDQNGNRLIDDLLGVELTIFEDDDWEVLYAHMDDLVETLQGQGKRPMAIPVGGSSPLGALAFYEASREVALQQSTPFDWIVTASSSGSTQTGLSYGCRELPTRVLGICSDPEPEIVHDFAALGDGLAALLDLDFRLGPDDFLLSTDFVGPGYGVPSAEGWAALDLMAKTEGILLDPIYTAKALAGLIDLVRRQQVTGRVLFWHTGGQPALFAFPGRVDQ